MSEISKRQVPKSPKEKSRLRRRGNEVDVGDIGLHRTKDSTDYILRYAVPTLADTLDAKERSFRSMIGKEGSLTRTAAKYLNKNDRVVYDVFIERSVDRDDNLKKVGHVTLQIIITHYHMLDEAELIAEWPILEELNAADDLLADAAMQHADSFRTADDIDLDDPLLNAEMMQGQIDYLSELDEDDEESMPSALLGSEVERYFERKLRLTTGHRPSLTISAGYETDESSYGLKIGDKYSLSLIGDNPAELAVIAQLGKETFVLIDSEAMKEFMYALEVVGILKRKHKKHA